MQHEVTRVFVKKLEAMLDFYMTNLQAELLEQTDTTALLAIDEDLFEFVESYQSLQPIQIAVQYGQYQDFLKRCKRLGGIEINKYNQDNQISYRAVLNDIEGNRVYLYYHQVFIPDSIGA